MTDKESNEVNPWAGVPEYGDGRQFAEPSRETKLLIAADAARIDYVEGETRQFTGNESEGVKKFMAEGLIWSRELWVDRMTFLPFDERVQQIELFMANLREAKTAQEIDEEPDFTRRLRDIPIYR